MIRKGDADFFSIFSKFSKAITHRLMIQKKTYSRLCYIFMLLNSKEMLIF